MGNVTTISKSYYGGFHKLNDIGYYIREDEIMLYNRDESEIEKIINLLNKYRIRTELDKAIEAVIADIKSKDFKLSSLNDFNTILNLAPGRFEDYYMPAIRQEIEIKTE